MRTFRVLGFVVFAWAVIYLLGAFYAWDFNAGNWSEFSRFLVTLLAGCAILPCAAIAMGDLP